MSYTTIFNQSAANGDGYINAVDAPFVDPKLKHEENIRHHYTRTGDTDNVGIIATNVRSPDSDPAHIKKKEQEHKKLLERLREHQLWLLRQMEEIQRNIEDLTLEIEEYGRQLDAMNKFIKDFKDNGKDALDDEGYPKDNPKAKAAIIAWEQRSGKKFDPVADDAQTVLLLIADDLDDRKTQKADARDVEQKKWDELNGQRIATEDAINEFEQNGYTNKQRV